MIPAASTSRARHRRRPGARPPRRRAGARAALLPARAVAALSGLAALVLGALVLAGCGQVAATGGSTPAASGSDAAAVATSAGGAPEVADVTLIMDWVPWVLDIPVDVAQAQGFYAAHGLTVKQVVPAGATDVVKFVSTGKAQFGLYYAPDTLTGVAEGAPLLSVAALMSHAPVGVAMAPGVHVSTPAGLAGKTAGVVMVPSTRASFETMLRAGGVDPSSVKVVDPGFDLVPPLLTGRYDAVAVTQFGELVQADRAGRKLDYLDFRDWGTPDYAFLNVVTQRGFAQKDSATVRAFVAATTEGLSWAVAHPAQAVALYVKRHPELQSDLLVAQWKAAIPSLDVAAGGHPAGWQDVASWNALNVWMVKTGQIGTPADVTGAVSNAYLPPR